MKKSIEGRLIDLETALGLVEGPDRIEVLEVVYHDALTGEDFLHDVINLTRPASEKWLSLEELKEYALTNGLVLDPELEPGPAEAGQEE